MIFGLGDVPQVLIGFMLGLVAVIVNTLNGLDRVPRALIKTARIHRLGPLAAAPRDDDVRALVAQGGGDRAAEPAGGGEHDRGASGQSEIHQGSSSRSTMRWQPPGYTWINARGDLQHPARALAR